MKTPLLVILLLLPAVCSGQLLWSESRDQVTIDHSLLDDVIAKSTRQFNVTIAGSTHRVVVDKVSAPNLGVTSLLGRIDDSDKSFFLLCRTEKGATIAFFRTGDGSSYRLDHTRGRDLVYQVEAEDFKSCAGALEPGRVRREGEPHPFTPVRPLLGADKNRSVADDGSRHDIIVGYTPAAETFMGGQDFIRAEAQLAVDAANFVYDNSNVGSRLRLVFVMPTDYQEISAWNFNDHVVYLANPYDGHMDDMLTQRNLVGADFVSVLIDGRNTMGDLIACGVAPVMQEGMVNEYFEDIAVSIVSVQCAASNWTLAHEVGHNRGCAHDRDHVNVYGAYPYSFGHLFAFDHDLGTGLRTVMSYDHFYFPHERVPFFSNPEVSFGGDATGVLPGLDGQADNALTHNNTSVVCAAFRGERTFVKFSYSQGNSDGLLLFPFTTIADAVVGSRDGGTIMIQESKPDFIGILGEARSFNSDAVGGVVLGGP